MLSQLRVIDIPTTQKNGDDVTFRMMMVNNTLQAIVDANNPSQDYLQFSRLMDPIISEYFKDKKILILGLGGGVIANQFIKKKFFAGFEKPIFSLTSKDLKSSY